MEAEEDKKSEMRHLAQNMSNIAVSCVAIDSLQVMLQTC